MDQQTLELAQAIKQWHDSRVANCRTVIDVPAGTDIRLQVVDGSEMVIPGDSDKAKGVRIGFILALEQFGKLPFTLDQKHAPAEPQAPDNAAAKELAEKLNGTHDVFHPSKEVIEFAKANGLVIVWGASDDLIEFDGAFRDEGSVYDGGTVLVDAEGLLPDSADDLDTDEERQRYYERKKVAKAINALFNENDYLWSYETEIPHFTFDIVETFGSPNDTTPYCRAVIFALADLK